MRVCVFVYSKSKLALLACLGITKPQSKALVCQYPCYLGGALHTAPGLYLSLEYPPCKLASLEALVLSQTPIIGVYHFYYTKRHVYERHSHYLRKVCVVCVSDYTSYST